MYRRLALYILLQISLVFLCFVTVPFWGPSVLSTQSYAHGLAKELLLVWQILILLRFKQEVLMLGIALFLGGLSLRWPRYAYLASPLIFIALQPLKFDPSLAFGTIWLALNLLPWALSPALAWIPGMGLLLPLPLLRLLVPQGRVLRVLIPPFLAAGVLLLHTNASFFAYEALLFDRWPETSPETGVVTLAHTPPGLKSDFHSVDWVDGIVNVVAESQNKLFYYDTYHPDQPPVSADLPPWWGPAEGLVMDSEIDPSTGKIYTLDGPNTVVARQLENGQLNKVQQSARLPLYVTHTYAHLVKEDERIYFFAVGARTPEKPAQMMSLSLSDLGDLQTIAFQDRQGQPIPTLRDIAWLPPLKKFLLVPDMGEGLYLADVHQPVADLWLDIPALNGKPRYVEGYGLLIPMPERMEIWLVDPLTSDIRRIRTQPGVRTADIDRERGLLLTASVLTGQVWVQQLDGSLVARYDGLMPMMREMTIDQKRHEAWLSTWTTLYRISYGNLPQ